MTITVIPSAVKETWQWNTDILKTIDGTESRFSLRPFPRITLQCQYETLSQENRRKLRDRLQTLIKGAFFTPVWPYATNLSQDTASAGTRIYFDPIRVPVNDGGELLLINEENYQFVTVDAVQSDGATLVDVLAQDVTTKWFVCLAMNAIIPSRVTGSVFSVTENIDIEYQSFNANLPIQRPGTSASLTTFNSLTVLDKTMIANQSSDVIYNRDLIDFGNKRAQQSQLPWASYNRRVSFFINRMFVPEEFDYWRLFFDTVKGSWKPFYLSTNMQDLTVASGSGASITFNETMLESDDPAYQCVEVELENGTISRHVLSEKSDSSFTITPAFPAGAVQRISYLLKCRMSDTIIFEHGRSGSVVNFDVSLTDAG